MGNGARAQFTIFRTDPEGGLFKVVLFSIERGGESKTICKGSRQVVVSSRISWDAVIAL